jgi:hypothetical protein
LKNVRTRRIRRNLLLHIMFSLCDETDGQAFQLLSTAVGTIVGLIAIGEFIGRGVNYTKTLLDGDDDEAELLDEMDGNNSISERAVSWVQWIN